MEIGKKIIALRKQRGWTQYRLFKEAGISQSNLSRIEGGLLSPSYKQLCKIAVALNVSIQEFDIINDKRLEKLNFETKPLAEEIIDIKDDEMFHIIETMIRQILRLPEDYQRSIAKIIDSMRP